MSERDNPGPQEPRHDGDIPPGSQDGAAAQQPGSSSAGGSAPPPGAGGTGAPGGWPAPSWEPPAYGAQARPGHAQQGQTGYGQQGYGSSYGGPGYGSVGYGSPGYGPPSYGQPGYAQGSAEHAGAQTTPQPAFAGASPGWTPEGAAPAARRPSRWRLGVAGLVAGALIGGGTGAGVVALADRSGGTSTTAAGPSAQNVVIKDPTNATTATAAAGKAAPSVVTIYVTNDQGAGSGSGVVLSSDGYVLTNNHVVTLEGSGTGQVQVRTANGAMYDADVVGTDASDDLAVVKLSGAKGLTPATFADSDKVQVGDLAVAIGAPLGLSNTVTDGIISATGRAVETGSTQNDATVIDALQTDAAINPGNSGGALVDGAGAVIGINTAIASVAAEGSGGQDAQSGNIGVGFAIPSNSAKRIADQIIKTRTATHAVLGVSARTASSGQNPEAGLGAQVVSVTSGGPAEKAGLQAGDVVTGVGDRMVTSSVDLTAVVRSQTPGKTVTLTVKRGTDTRKVQVTLGETNG